MTFKRLLFALKGERTSNECKYIMFSLCCVLILALTLVCLATDSEKFAEMKLATASPPKDGFRLMDDAEFPPVAQPSDWVISTLCTFYLLSLSLFCSVPFCGSHWDVYFNYSHSINKSKFFINLMFFSPTVLMLY